MSIVSRFPSPLRSAIAVVLLVLAPSMALSQAPAARAPAGTHAPANAPVPDPAAVLAAAKAASGGAAWDALRSQHSEVVLRVANIDGKVERWSDIATGHSVLKFEIATLTGTAGFDGKVAWTQEGPDPIIDTSGTALELAVNAAYRDRLAFWFPERGRAKLAYKERAESEGRKYDVVTITPEGGRPFEFWINAETKLIERLVEREAEVTRTETYGDRRDVQGVSIPFHVRSRRGDPKFDEVVLVQKIAFNEPLTGIAFGPPVEPQEFMFPAGRPAVDVDFQALSGHLFVRVMLDGRGPFRMLLDAGGANVISKETAQLLAGTGKPIANPTRVAVTSINGVELTAQRYAVADIESLLRRVEGLDDVAGIIGLEWFVRMPIRIDYARSRLTFYDPAGFTADRKGTKVPVASRGRLPKVAGSIDGFEGLFEIDTGSRASLTLVPAFAERNGLEKRYDAKNEAITGAGVSGPVRAMLARGKLLKLGAVEVPSPVIAIPRGAAPSPERTDVAGNVGYGVLRQFAVTYDLPNDALYLDRYINAGAADITDRGGVWLERADDGYKVVDVVAGGPAAAAGLKAGDLIVEVNGAPWSATSLPVLRDALRGAPGSRLRLKTSGGSEATLVLRDLV